jgi:hypothetical protein
MIDVTGLTGAERRLAAFAEERFGEHLGAFLLAGYGEDRMLRTRRFAITLGNGVGVERHVFLKVIVDGNGRAGAFLPHRKDPLVLLALLRMLLHDGRGARHRVSYPYTEVLRLLGWEGTAECHAAIEEAVARYFSLSYQPVESLAELTGESPTVRVRKQRLIVGYEFAERSRGDGRPAGRALNEVDFDPVLAEQLRRGRFFDADRKHVRTLTCLLKIPTR